MSPFSLIARKQEVMRRADATSGTEAHLDDERRIVVEHDRFDALARAIADFTSRRRLLQGAAAGGVGTALGLAGAGVLPGWGDAEAANKKKKRRKKKKRKQKKAKKKCEKTCSTEVFCEEAFCNNKSKCKIRAAEGCTLVTPSNLGEWFGYDDGPVDEGIDNSVLDFVAGPGTSPNEVGSVEIAVSGEERYNIATYQFSGLELDDITELSYSTYNGSVGNPGSLNRSGYLQFNVDFDGSDTWQRRLGFLPADNGTIQQDTWQTWDCIAGGAAEWFYSGTTWPGGSTPGSTTKTWNDILTEYPGVRVRVTDSWLGIRIGEPYPDGYTENIATFTIGIEGEVQTVVFRPDPA